MAKLVQELCSLETPARLWPLLVTPPGQMPSIPAPTSPKGCCETPGRQAALSSINGPYCAQRSDCWDSTKVVVNPERSQHGCSRPCGPSGPGQHRLCEEPHKARALAPTCPLASQPSRKVVPPNCGQCLTCAPRKPRALPQRSCSDVTGSGNPAYPDVTAPRRAAPRRAELS